MNLANSQYLFILKVREKCTRLELVPRFSDSGVIALSLAAATLETRTDGGSLARSVPAETEEIESENRLFEAKLKECHTSIPNLISRRQFNDRRKSVSSFCEQIHSRIANHIDGDEEHFCIRLQAHRGCRVARGKRCKMGRTGDFHKAPDFGCCASQGRHYFGYKLHVLGGLMWSHPFIRPFQGECIRHQLSEGHQAALPRLQYLRKQWIHQCGGSPT